MSLKRLISKLKRFSQFFIVSPKTWSQPKKCEALIYGLTGAQYLVPYLSDYSVEIISVNGESINVPCFLRASLKANFWMGEPIQAYIDALIQAASPQLIVTFADNDPAFYTISERFPKAKSLLVQNGRRDNWLDRLPTYKAFHVDYMLTHNTSVGMYYGRHIHGEVMSIGSLKNNKVTKAADFQPGSILFISEYRVKPKDNAPLLQDENGIPVHFDQFYSIEIYVLHFLSKWCAENNKLLQICGCFVENQHIEHDFYAMHIEGCEWEYLPKTESDLYGSYKSVDAAEIVVFLESTLGYESIARGKKTACFACRDIFRTTGTRRFGWPAILPIRGPFWTNELRDIEFRQIMDYLVGVDGEEWEKIQTRYASTLMEYDPGNTRLGALIKQILPNPRNTRHVQ